MSSTPHEGYGRLAKLVALLDSPVEGERIAALGAVNRQLEAMGLRWRDMATELPGSAAAAPLDHVALAAGLVRDGRGLLTRWETEFLVGIAGSAVLSAKQAVILDGIKRKVELAGMAARGAA